MKKLIIISLTIIMFFFKNSAISNNQESFYDLEIESINGEIIKLKDYRDKVILIVNTASYCGFTKQYTDLQNLYEKYKDKNFVVLGVPSNQFGGQEPGSNKEIKEFCETNFDINFPMTEKVNVKGDDAHPIYKWAKENFGNSSVPKWNFHKIIINNEGKIEEAYGSFAKPLSSKIITVLEKIL